MPIYVKIEKNTYRDSIACLNATYVASETKGVTLAYVSMATDSNKQTVKALELLHPEMDLASEADWVIAANCVDEHAFAAALAAIEEAETIALQSGRQSFQTFAQAHKAMPDANLATIAVPGEHALTETKRCLEAGLHCLVFSANVPPEDEREMKALALSKGLLCMGPDCGVANINGIALALGSIENRGPFGICGASGCGLQHIGALLHQNGSGVSQAIGTGGGDLKDAIGGPMMLLGIDALEQDPKTAYIVLISRKPGEAVFQKIMERVSRVSKPVLIFMMGAQRAPIEAAGAIYAENLDDCAQKALAMVGKTIHYTAHEEIHRLATEAIVGMAPAQKYVRGAYLGGTYCDEAMQALSACVGPVYSNCPLKPEWQLEDATVSVRHSVVDYGEEEFTRSKPHPTIDPAVRQPAFLREAKDPTVAVILMDMILCPPGPPDPSGAIVSDIFAAKEMAKARGGKLAVIASVLGTDRDLQNAPRQVEILKKAGVMVLETNYRAALLAGEIARLLEARV